jgi:UDP-N-acetylmuramoyl-tripeptide--D-alanyl-D-alanine ligase
VITSVGPVHLELLGTVERVAQAKAEILHHLAPGGVAVVPAGEPLLRPHLAEHAGRVVGFGDGEDADVRLVAFRRMEGGGEAEIALHGRTLNVPVNFTSRHDALNLTAAAAVYDVLGLPADELARGAGDVRFSRWRGEEIELPGGGPADRGLLQRQPDVDGGGAAPPGGRVGGPPDGRRARRHGELGPDGPTHHTEVGRLADELGIELVVAVGELARGYGGSWFATRDERVGAIGELTRAG